MQLFGKLKNCIPAIVYFSFTLIGTFYFYVFNSVSEPLFPLFADRYYTAFQVVFLFFWTWFVMQICDKISVYVSWFLVFLPNITFILHLVEVFRGKIIL